MTDWVAFLLLGRENAAHERLVRAGRRFARFVLRPESAWRRRRRLSRMPGDALLSDEELATLTDAKLTSLVEERSNLRGVDARTAVEILKGGPPEDEDW